MSNRIQPVAVGLLFVLLAATPAIAFTFAPSQTKWEPGPNSASEHGMDAPNGPRTPGSATFSIMPGGLTDVVGAVLGGNSLDMSHGFIPPGRTVPITDLDVPGFNDEKDYAKVIDRALSLWANASGFKNLGQVADGGAPAGDGPATGVILGPPAGGPGHLGDIRVAAWEIDPDLADSNVLAHAFPPDTEATVPFQGFAGTLGGDLHFDVNRNWVNDKKAVAAKGEFDFFTIALHELGHSIGLGHSSVPGSVMFEAYTGAKRRLHRDDVQGIRELYGVRDRVKGLRLDLSELTDRIEETVDNVFAVVGVPYDAWPDALPDGRLITASTDRAGLSYLAAPEPSTVTAVMTVVFIMIARCVSSRRRSEFRRSHSYR
jgi:hypothetical protein